MPTICAYCLCLSVPVCACLCLPIYAYLSVLPVYAYLSIPTVCASCLCYCLYLPVCNLGERSARSKAPPDLINWLIILIWIVLYGRSLAVYSNGGRLGCLHRRPWFDSATGRYWSSGSIRLIDWLDRLWRSLDGCLNGGRLVLAVVVWFWRWSSGSGGGRLVLATVVWFWRRSSGSGDGRLVLG